MPILLKMQKPDIKVRILDIQFQNFRETLKGTWYNKTFEEHGEIRKTKIRMWTVWLLTSLQSLNMKKMIKNKFLIEKKC